MAQDFLALLEADRADEVKAIAQYDYHIALIEIPEVKEKLLEIRNEEQHHLEELTALISKYGGKTYEALKKLQASLG